MLSFLYQHWVVVIGVLLGIDVLAFIIRKANPMNFPSVFDTKEGREAFVENFIASLPGWKSR
jgi:hypothetical protein